MIERDFEPDAPALYSDKDLAALLARMERIARAATPPRARMGGTAFYRPGDRKDPR